MQAGCMEREEMKIKCVHDCDMDYDVKRQSGK